MDSGCLSGQTRKQVYVDSLLQGIEKASDKERVLLYQTLLDPINNPHRSYLINLRSIDKVAQDDVFVNGNCLPISKKYREGFYKKIATF